ncbi:MAG: hypothetical protein EWV80_10665 [Microcystis aeruginosa Ma_QC_B_20070730_S2]|uniref:Uncharacterized protein n=1 Tax=Microcystis aeruginosa Ma_QC_B_20070730_S2 TaxID=2486256 RepID=A0A552DRM4_MICAE|nr:MAG: hypothetical protein EWV80_10665 [Microcystis aeruginosa Ma_QC_B_20070730_S2]
MISLTYIGSIDLCVLCVFVVRSTPSLGGMYLRIHFTHQTWESRSFTKQHFSRVSPLRRWQSHSIKNPALRVYVC